jgi:hypothetical protein
MSTDQKVDWEFADNFLFHSALLDVITKQHSTLSADSSNVHGGNTIQQKFSSLNSVWFVSVRSGTASSSFSNFAFSAASRIVSSTIHKPYCRSELFKYSTACSTMFSSVSIKYNNTRSQLLSPDGRHFIPLSPTVTDCDELRSCSEHYCWCLILAGCDLVWMGNNYSILEAFTSWQIKIEDVNSWRFKEWTSRHIPHDLFFNNTDVNKPTYDVILPMHVRT